MDENPKQKQIDILVVDDDSASQTMLAQVLGSEGWRVRIATSAGQALQELAGGNWSLVVVNVSLISFAGLLFTTLQELVLAPSLESGKRRLGVLFVVPEDAEPASRSMLEAQGLPYVNKPFHLHEFLERVGDLLMETEAISAPIRRVRLEGKKVSRWEGLGGRDLTSGRGSARSSDRNTSMFAGRSDYYSMTEEELAEYERAEATETALKKKKKLNPDRL